MNCVLVGVLGSVLVGLGIYMGRNEPTGWVAFDIIIVCSLMIGGMYFLASLDGRDQR